jgi:hypothetical protein
LGVVSLRGGMASGHGENSGVAQCASVSAKVEWEALLRAGVALAKGSARISVIKPPGSRRLLMK